jgi:hypothetical protein
MDNLFVLWCESRVVLSYQSAQSTWTLDVRVKYPFFLMEIIARGS